MLRPYRLKRIFRGGYQVYSRKNDQLVGSVIRRGNDWEPAAFVYVGNFPEQTRNFFPHASRIAAADLVWEERDRRVADREGETYDHY